MGTIRTIVVTIVVAALGFLGFHYWKTTRTPPSPALVFEETIPTGDVPVIIRTNGGWLEVAKVAHNRSYRMKRDATLFGYAVPHCRADATVTLRAYYTYRVRLAKEWRALITADRKFKVAVPPLTPALPVAWDTRTLRKQYENCVFAPGEDNMDQLEHSISTKLAKEASSAVYTGFVRDSAAKTVTEFVRKWMLAQKRYEYARAYPVEIEFQK